MKKGLKRFGLTVLVVIALVSIVDVAAGKVLDWMLPQISGQGDLGKQHFALYNVETPIVIVGSSRAAHHYMPQLFEDSLGLAAYNVGIDGCFIKHNCCVINTILERYSPKLIVWELLPQSFYKGMNDKIDGIYPYYGRNSIATDIINQEVGYGETLKLRYNLYRYNSKVCRIAMRYQGRHSYVDPNINGYEPSVPKTLLSPLTMREDIREDTAIDSARVTLFCNTIANAQAKGIPVVVVNSPMYAKYTEDPAALLMQELSDTMGFAYIDNSHLQEYLDSPSYFNDNVHLNTVGAEKYTALFIIQLRDIDWEHTSYPRTRMMPWGKNGQ